MAQEVVCPHCNGEKKVYVWPTWVTCGTCKGKGTLPAPK